MTAGAGTVLIAVLAKIAKTVLSHATNLRKKTIHEETTRGASPHARCASQR
jgi:hypothetical protein